VEETVVDGVILLSSTEEGFERQRYVEVYKLRNTAHLKGRHSMVIGEGGIKVFPRYAEDVAEAPPAALGLAERLPSGIRGLDPLIGGGLLKRSATLLVGSAGIGKSTMGLQFILEGVTRKEPGLIFTLEESPEQLEATADALGMSLRKWVEKGLVEVVYLSRERVRSAQFLTILGDTILRLKARRVLLDGVAYMQRESADADDLRQLLNKLVARFKRLDVTSMLTAESRSLHFGDAITEGGFSPVADNLLLLRYVAIDDALAPAIRIVKTRGSEHDRASYAFHLGKGGAHIARHPLKSAIPSTKGSAARRAPRTKGRLR
jgi:circadian clock protein KaiC